MNDRITLLATIACSALIIVALAGFAPETPSNSCVPSKELLAGQATTCVDTGNGLACVPAQK